MVINPSNIHRSVSLVNKSNVIASKATIGTTVNKRQRRSTLMGADTVGDVGINHAFRGFRHNPSDVTRLEFSRGAVRLECIDKDGVSSIWFICLLGGIRNVWVTIINSLWIRVPSMKVGLEAE